MADPLSIAGSVVGIAAAGIQVSVSLYALSETVSTASERIESIANDISSTCGILNQLKDLIDPKLGPTGTYVSNFTSTALHDISSALRHCRSIFKQVKNYLKKASRQLENSSATTTSRDKVSLSRFEKAKWPFLQPQFNDLRNDLRDAKSNLLLMVAVANLGIANRNAAGRRVNEQERAEMRATIVRLQRAGTGTMDVVSLTSDESEIIIRQSGFKRLFKKLGRELGAWRKGRKGRDGERESESESESEDEGVAVGERSITPPRSRPRPRRGEIPPMTSVEQRRPASLAGSMQPQSDSLRADGEDQQDIAEDPPAEATREVDAENNEESRERVSNTPMEPELAVEAPADTTTVVDGDTNPQENVDTEGPQMNGQVMETLGDLEAAAPKTYVLTSDNSKTEDIKTQEDQADKHEDVAEVEQTQAIGHTDNGIDGSREDPRARTPELAPTKPVRTDFVQTFDVAVQTLIQGAFHPKQVLQSAPSSPGVGSSKPAPRPQDTTVSSEKKKGKQKSEGRYIPELDVYEYSFGSESDSLEPPESKSGLHAWITSVTPGLNYGYGDSVAIHRLDLDDSELNSLLEQQRQPLKSLSKLNAYQRRLLLSHAEDRHSTIVFVDVWSQESITTVFGDLNVAILIWVTSSPDSAIGDFVPYKRVTRAATRIDRRPYEPDHYGDYRRDYILSDDLRDARMGSVEREFRRERIPRPDEEVRKVAEKVTQEAHERALAEAKAAAEAKVAAETKAVAEELEKAKKAAEEEAAKLKSVPDKKEPIKFKDCVGRKFTFPWHICKTWTGMEELIKQAFLHVDVIGPHVNEGHYDLVDEKGEIILPQVWETVIQPGASITQHMWPMPEPPPPTAAPASMPPPGPPGPPGPSKQYDFEKLPGINSRLSGDLPPPPFITRPAKSKSKKRPGKPSTPYLPPPPPPPGMGGIPPPPGFTIPPPPTIPITLDSDSDSSRAARRRRRAEPSALLKWAAGGPPPKLKIGNIVNKFKPTIHYDMLDDDEADDKVVDDLLLKWIEGGDGKAGKKNKGKKTVGVVERAGKGVAGPGPSGAVARSPMSEKIA